MKHKRQHYIPSSYLQAWCDPECPAGQTPYVWLYSKDGSVFRKKSPEKIFYEKDMYTVFADDGQRVLTLEYNLSKLENEFAKLRKNKLTQRLPLIFKEHFILCLFTMAMFGRTKAFGKHMSNQWRLPLEFGEKIKQKMEGMSAEEREQSLHPLPPSQINERSSLTLDEVRKFVAQPIQSSLSEIVTEFSPILFQMPFVIIEPGSSLGFITSDAPCVWFDPRMFENPLLFGVGGLISKTIEITLPLSPNQLLYFGWNLVDSGVYLQVYDEDLINQFNNRTRLQTHEHFVFNRQEMRRGWF